MKAFVVHNIGDYWCSNQKKGECEFCGDSRIKEGTTFWTVATGENTFFDTLFQAEAIILGKLTKIGIDIETMKSDLKKIKQSVQNKETEK